MRALAVLAALLLVLTVPSTPGSAHEDGIGHGALFTGLLAPTEAVERHLDWEGGPLQGGWVFLLAAKVFGAPLEATLSVADTPAGTWSVPPTPSGRWIATTLLPRDGVYNLTLTNVGSANATFAVYFDQSCNCVGKFIPSDIPDGMIIFNTDVTEPSSVLAQFNEPKAMRVRVTAALLANARGLWPDDFTVLAVSNAPVERKVREDLPPVWLHELRTEIDRPARVYYFVEGLEFLPANYTGPQDLLITPFYETGRPSGDGGLAVWALLGAAGGLAAVGVLLLWRGRGGSPAEKDGKKVTRRDAGRDARRTRSSPRRPRRR